MAIDTRTKEDRVYVPRMLGLFGMPDGTLAPTTITKLRDFLDRVAIKINGLISLGSARHASWAGNIDAQYLEFTTPAANVEFPVPHNLGRVPVFYVTGRVNRASVLFDNGGGNWTDTTLYLFATDAGVTFRILVW